MKRCFPHSHFPDFILHDLLSSKVFLHDPLEQEKCSGGKKAPAGLKGQVEG